MPGRNPEGMTAAELEEHYLQPDHSTFERACRAVAVEARPAERVAMVVTRRPFETRVEGVDRLIPPRSFLVGEAEFTERAAAPEQLRYGWRRGIAPSVTDSIDPVPAVGGSFFGRDDTVFITPHMTIPNPETVGVSPLVSTA